MSTSVVPPFFAGFIDDAVLFPPGDTQPVEALAKHRDHRAAWYADVLGPLLIPAELAIDGALAIGGATPTGATIPNATVPSATVPSATVPTGTLVPGGPGPAGGHPADGVTSRTQPYRAAGVDTVADLDVAVVGELERVEQFLGRVSDTSAIRRIEVAVAKRGEDPQPGLGALLELSARHPTLDVLAEVPLTWGLSRALDTLADARDGGLRVAPKFRVGGLAAELFPTPVELAAIICACRDRGLTFALGPGLRRAVRHSDAETGFTHHGFLNVLAATTVAAQGAEVAPVAERLAATDAVPLIEAIRPFRTSARPLWTAFAVRHVRAVVADLTGLGLLAEEPPD